MKKFVCTGLVTVMLLFLFVGCSQENEQIVGNNKTKGNVAGIYYYTSVEKDVYNEVLVLQEDGSVRTSLKGSPEETIYRTWKLDGDIIVIADVSDDRITGYAYLVDDGLIYNDDYYKKMK